MATKPPRALLCHCLKCDDKWTVRMQLIQDPEPAPKGRGRKNQKRMVWIFPPESFEECGGCGAKNRGELRVVDIILARTDGGGRMKMHIPGYQQSPSVEVTSLNMEDNDLVQE